MEFNSSLPVLADIPSVLYNLIAPPPISPLFQKGGPMEGYNEDLVFTAAFIVFLGVIDLAIVRPLLHPKARYFALHFVANMVSAVAAFPDMRRGITEDPKTVFSGPTQTMVANSAVAAIHLYHCIAFKLTAADIFHHVTFVTILCGAAIPGKHTGGIANNFGCFFLSGVPGGIDYLLLVLNYQGVIDRAFEKRWYTRINVWMRGPSMVVYTFLAWCTWYHGNVQVPTAALILIVGLHLYNGLHYLEQAVETGAIFMYKAKLEKMGIKLPGKEKQD